MKRKPNVDKTEKYVHFFVKDVILKYKKPKKILLDLISEINNNNNYYYYYYYHDDDDDDDDDENNNY